MLSEGEEKRGKSKKVGNSIMEPALESRFRRLRVRLGLGEVAMIFAGFADLAALAGMGVSQIAGYSISESICGIISIPHRGINNIQNDKYNRNKKVSEVFTYTLVTYVISISIYIVIMCLQGIIMSTTGLSNEAKQVVLPYVSIRMVGTLLYTASLSFYIYLRSSGLEKSATSCRVICSITNVVLDIVVMVLKMGAVGVALAGAMSEAVELILVILAVYWGGARLKRKHFRLVKVEMGPVWAMMASKSVQHIKRFVTGMMLSSLGDYNYSIYGLLDSMCGLILYYVSPAVQVVVILYHEFKQKIQSIYKRLLVITLKYTAYYTVAAFVFIIGYYLFYRNKGIELNIVWLIVSGVLAIVLAELNNLGMGFLIINEKYKAINTLSIVTMVLSIIISYICYKLGNPYLCYIIPFVVTTCINIKYSLSVGIKTVE